MLFLTKLHLQNFCNYDNHTFEFKKPDGSPYQYICFFGPNGIGKCLVGSTYINTYEYGMIQISELFSGKRLLENSWYDTNFNIECQGQFYPVRKLYYNGKKKTIKIKTKCGYSLEGSFDKHSILAVKSGTIQFVRLRDLKIGDFVCLSRNSEFQSKSEISDILSRLLGYLTTEETINSNIKFSNSDPEINEDFRLLFAQEFNVELFPSDKSNHQCIYIPLKYHDKLLKAGLRNQKSHNKMVPTSILSGARTVIIEFLRGYFEGNGGIKKNTQSVTCYSKSKILMSQIQLLLLRLGIISALASKKYKSYNFWEISIQGKDIIKFARIIGFISQRKKEELDDILLQIDLTSQNPNRDIIPVSLVQSWIESIEEYINIQYINFLQNTIKHGVSREKIKYWINTINNTTKAHSNTITTIEEPEWLNDNYFFDTIDTIEYDNADLFDVSVNEVHSFWSNGFTSHNTTLLEAISLLTMNQTGRDTAYIKRSLRKYVRNKDYDPSYEKISGHKYKNDFSIEYEDKLPEMVIEGTYEMDGQSYVVRLNQNGFDRNDFVPNENNPGPWGDNHLLYRQRIAHFITADSDLSLSKFQLHKEKIQDFETITSTIMRYPTECCEPTGILPIDQQYCTDFVIHKAGHKIHYKRMSAGERKIAKSFSQLLNLVYDLEHPDPGDPPMPGWPRLLLFDNIEMHIYYDRHVQMIDCLKKYFPLQQIFATTHSGILIERFLQGKNDQNSELMIDLEKING